MVNDTRLLEAALGDGRKKIEGNESETIVLQRRCVRAARDIPAGTVLQRADLDVLRPAPQHAIPAHLVESVVGSTLMVPMQQGQEITWGDLGQ
jgi:sialic acid synthase SpsE